MSLRSGRFPADESLGWLFLVGWLRGKANIKQDYVFPLGPARGDPAAGRRVDYGELGEPPMYVQLQLSTSDFSRLDGMDPDAVDSLIPPAGALVRDRDLARFARLSALKELGLELRVRNATLWELQSLQGLESLFLRGRRVAGPALQVVGALPRLASLSLRGSDVRDRDMQRVAGARGLRFFDASGTAVTDRGVAELAPLVELQALVLSGVRITDSGMRVLSGFKALSTLNLVGADVTRQGLSALAGLPISWLDLTGCRRIGDDCLEALSALPNLRHLHLWKAAVTEAGLQRIKTALPDCVVSP